MTKEERQKICDELKNINLGSDFDEFQNIAYNQPVYAGNVLSHQGCRRLMDLGLVMRYEGDYVLTNKGTVLKENLQAAHDTMCNGVLYKPKGCKLTENFKENGCGMCGKGNYENCKNP